LLRKYRLGWVRRSKVNSTNLFSAHPTHSGHSRPHRHATYPARTPPHTRPYTPPHTSMLCLPSALLLLSPCPRPAASSPRSPSYPPATHGR
jgi:hypothetical protein